MKGKIGYIYIFLAGICWSTLGFIVSKINNYNFSSDQIALFRMVVGVIVISIYGKMTVPTMFKITKKGILYVIAIGFMCQFLFNISYMNSICIVGASMAAVLLYTSPLFVAIFSAIVYKENINRIKMVSLVFCMIGAFLAVTGGNVDFTNLNGMGVFAGIMAAVTYALLPIFSKNALKEMDNMTMISYSFLVATILMFFKVNPVATISQVDNIGIFILVIAIGVIPSALAYILYSTGISKNVELSIVGVVASVELVFSVIIGWTLLGEDFAFVKLIGVLFMVLSTFIAVKAISPVEQDQVEDKYDIQVVKQEGISTN